MDVAGFTVVIPTCNRADHARPCLAPFLEPEARDVEVILVGDGSTDATGEIAQAVAAASRGADIRCFKTPNRGAAAARNFGIARATGELKVCEDIDFFLRAGRPFAGKKYGFQGFCGIFGAIDPDCRRRP